jgi:hypothetical protein
VLRSELVARRLPPDVAPELRQELQEAVAVARRSLGEVREAVAGYLPDPAGHARELHEVFLLSETGSSPRPAQSASTAKLRGHRHEFAMRELERRRSEM